MEHRIAEPLPPAVPAKDGPQVSWRDLREWIALLERNNELQRITKPVDADEELGAITVRPPIMMPTLPKLANPHMA